MVTGCATPVDSGTTLCNAGLCSHFPKGLHMSPALNRRLAARAVWLAAAQVFIRLGNIQAARDAFLEARRLMQVRP